MTTTTSCSTTFVLAKSAFSLDGVPPYLPPQSGAPKGVLMKELPRTGSHQQTREALDNALRHATWTPDKPFKPSRTQGKAATGVTSLAAVVGAVVTASVAASPWALFFTKR